MSLVDLVAVALSTGPYKRRRLVGPAPTAQDGHSAPLPPGGAALASATRVAAAAAAAASHAGAHLATPDNESEDTDNESEDRYQAGPTGPTRPSGSTGSASHQPAAAAGSSHGDNSKEEQRQNRCERGHPRPPASPCHCVFLAAEGGVSSVTTRPSSCRVHLFAFPLTGA